MNQKVLDIAVKATVHKGLTLRNRNNGHIKEKKHKESISKCKRHIFKYLGTRATSGGKCTSEKSTNNMTRQNSLQMNEKYLV